MSWYYGTYSCGHEGRTNIVGKTKDREWKAERHFEGLCTECWEIEKQRKFDEANAKAAAEAAEYGLPDLTGTEKQVAWANTLRQNWISEAEKWIVYSEGRLDRGRFKNHPEEAEQLKKGIAAMKVAMEARLLEEASARFWIDNRHETVNGFLNEAGEKALQEPEIKPVEVPEAVQQEAMEEMVIRPSEPTTSLVTEIRIKENLVSAKYPEKNEEFRLLARGLNFTWQNNRWERQTGIKSGLAMDRATEIGVKLLAKGFPVRVYDDTLQAKILASDYEPECSRWIMNTDTGKFIVKWDRDEADFYNESKRLPGAKWKSRSGMLVPKEAFREIQDFAAQYGFKLSSGAAKLIEEAQAEYEAAMVADVTVPEKDQLPQPGSRPVLEAEESGIDASLRD